MPTSTLDAVRDRIEDARDALRNRRRTRVDLRDQQTPIRHQHGQRTCTHFAALAAIEAAYRREDVHVDLSDEFARAAIKMMWLHDWTDVAAAGADARENQATFAAGGSTAGTLELLSTTLPSVPEALAPYEQRWDVNDDPRLANAWNSPFWDTQRAINDFTFDNDVLARTALDGAMTYRGRGFRRLSFDGSTPDTILHAIEEELRAGREVCIGMTMAGTLRNAGTPGARLYDTGGTGTGGHAMLAVGYDRSDPDPANHYVIAKNSYGADHSFCRPDGFTYLTYDFVRAHVTQAAVIEGVEPPRPLPEMRFIGRWNLCYDGHEGLLDIVRLPGAMREMVARRDDLKDRRLGIFWDAKGKAHRVNGHMIHEAERGNVICFWIDRDNPNADYETLGGRAFVYHLSEDGTLAAGHQTDPDGRDWAGFMQRADASHGWAPTERRGAGPDWSDTVGHWDVHTGAGPSTSHFEIRVDPRTNLPVVLMGRLVIPSDIPPGATRRHFAMRSGRLLHGRFHRLSWRRDMAAGLINHGPGATLVPAVFIRRTRA